MSQQNETDYHIQHFCDGNERVIPFYDLTTMLNKLIPNSMMITVDDMEANSNLAGICHFYVRTNDEALLNYFPLEKGRFVQRCHALYFERSYRFRQSLLNAEETEFVEIGPLYPIRTDGDGNCLLHAISICIWGCHDPIMRDFQQQTNYLYHRRLLHIYILRNANILFLHYCAAGESRPIHNHFTEVAAICLFLLSLTVF